MVILQASTAATQFNNNQRYGLCFTGGKDCMLALHILTSEPYCIQKQNIKLVTFHPKDPSFKAHPLPVINNLARLLDMELVCCEIDENGDFEEEYINALSSLDIDVIVTGDMINFGWMEGICSSLETIKLWCPLMNMDRDHALNLILNRYRMTVLITCVKNNIGINSLVGRVFDYGCVQVLKTQGADVCGELGEFHTVVVKSSLYANNGQLTIKHDDIVVDDTNGYRHLARGWHEH